MFCKLNCCCINCSYIKMVTHFTGISRLAIRNIIKPNSVNKSANLPLLTSGKPKREFNCRQFCYIKVQKFNLRSVNRLFSLSKNTAPLFSGFPFILMIAKELVEFPKVVKYNSVNIIRNCLAQFEFVIAQRIRRGQQMFTLYTRLWDKVTLKLIVEKMKMNLFRRGKEMLMGASVCTVFNWEKERIQDEEIDKHCKELQICEILKKYLLENNVREAEDSSMDEIICPDLNWEPFIKDDELTVWKMEENDRKGSGLYCYKMFGRYNDVTASDFLAVFLDTVDRKKWDMHVVKLYIIESEPETNSDVIYWETKWPKLFNNRDYVYTRRFKVDKQKKIMTVVNRSTRHPQIPEFTNKTRVNEYWSYMVIRPFQDFEKPGIEFSLTYFDNPGASLPKAISLWASATGMPEYLKKLRLAALQLGSNRKSQSDGESRDSRGSKSPPPSGSNSVVPANPSVSGQPDHLSPLATYVHWARSFLF